MWRFAQRQMPSTFVRFQSVPKERFSNPFPIFTATRTIHDLRIGVVKENDKETRVSIVPSHVEQLVKKGAHIQIESDAGTKSGFTNEMYLQSGAEVVSKEQVWKNDMVVCVRPPSLVCSFFFLSIVTFEKKILTKLFFIFSFRRMLKGLKIVIYWVYYKQDKIKN